MATGVTDIGGVVMKIVEYILSCNWKLKDGIKQRMALQYEA